MKDYSKLVKSLRCKRDDCEGCDLAFLDNDEGCMCQYAAKDDDAADAIEALQAEVDTLKRTDSKRCQECLYLGQPVGEQLIPKHGKWVEVDGLYKCSVCGELECCRGKYCPDCGAKMGGTE